MIYKLELKSVGNNETNIDCVLEIWNVGENEWERKPFTELTFGTIGDSHIVDLPNDAIGFHIYPKNFNAIAATFLSSSIE